MFCGDNAAVHLVGSYPVGHRLNEALSPKHEVCVTEHQRGSSQGVLRQFSGSSQGVLRQFSGSSQAVLRQFSGSSQAVLRQFSGSSQAVLREFSGSPGTADEEKNKLIAIFFIIINFI